MNRRKIEINSMQFEVWGNSPWIMIEATSPTNTGWIIVDEAATKLPDFLNNPLKYNALRRITPKGAVLPVMFSGITGRTMGDEINHILNQKL